MIGSHQEVLSRVLIRTAEEYSGSRPGAPEPLAPMPGKGRKTTQQADIQQRKTLHIERASEAPLVGSGVNTSFVKGFYSHWFQTG